LGSASRVLATKGCLLVSSSLNLSIIRNKSDIALVELLKLLLLNGINAVVLSKETQLYCLRAKLIRSESALIKVEARQCRLARDLPSCRENQIPRLHLLVKINISHFNDVAITDFREAEPL